MPDCLFNPSPASTNRSQKSVIPIPFSHCLNVHVVSAPGPNVERISMQSVQHTQAYSGLNGPRVYVVQCQNVKTCKLQVACGQWPCLDIIIHIPHDASNLRNSWQSGRVMVRSQHRIQLAWQVCLVVWNEDNRSPMYKDSDPMTWTRHRVTGLANVDNDYKLQVDHLMRS